MSNPETEPTTDAEDPQDGQLANQGPVPAEAEDVPDAGEGELGPQAVPADD